VSGDVIDANSARPPAASADQRFASLLYAVSHDLRSPLLTMSLSADLIEAAMQRGETSAEVALKALRHGAEDAERMLQALTLLSRAHRRRIEPARAPLRLVLAGYLVISEASELESRQVAVDAVSVREMLDAVTDEGMLELHVRMQDSFVLIEFDAEGLPPEADSPLSALTESLQYSAGSSLEALAVGQVLLERQGGGVGCTNGRVTVWLPLVADGGAR